MTSLDSSGLSDTDVSFEPTYHCRCNSQACTELFAEILVDDVGLERHLHLHGVLAAGAQTPAACSCSN